MIQMSRRKKIVFYILGFLVGVFLGGFTIFQIFFLSKVIPHGGI
jgi:hypothetical protein